MGGRTQFAPTLIGKTSSSCIECGEDGSGLDVFLQIMIVRLLARKYANVVICQVEEVRQWIVERT